jgi:hypothetical protein
MAEWLFRRRSFHDHEVFSVVFPEKSSGSSATEVRARFRIGLAARRSHIAMIAGWEVPLRHRSAWSILGAEQMPGI